MNINEHNTETMETHGNIVSNPQRQKGNALLFQDDFLLAIFLGILIFASARGKSWQNGEDQGATSPHQVLTADCNRFPKLFADWDPCRSGPSPKHLRKIGTFFRSCRGCAAQQSAGPRCMGTVDI